MPKLPSALVNLGLLERELGQVEYERGKLAAGSPGRKDLDARHAQLVAALDAEHAKLGR